MNDKELLILFRQLREKFFRQLGEAHVLYGVIEEELKSLWYTVSRKRKIAKPSQIEKKWKKVQKMTLSPIIEEVEYLSILGKGNINILRNKINPDRNFITHKIQNILYNDRRLTNLQNLIKINNDLNKNISKLQKDNRKLKIIAHDLIERRFLFEKGITK